MRSQPHLPLADPGPGTICYLIIARWPLHRAVLSRNSFENAAITYYGASMTFGGCTKSAVGSYWKCRTAGFTRINPILTCPRRPPNNWYAIVPRGLICVDLTTLGCVAPSSNPQNPCGLRGTSVKQRGDPPASSLQHLRTAKRYLGQTQPIITHL